MESSGVPGAVQLSAAAWEALRLPPDGAWDTSRDDDARLPPAVARDIKGKGRMHTTTVRAGTPAAARLRQLVDAPWPGTPEEAAAAAAAVGMLPSARLSTGKPPRSPSFRLE